MKSFIHLLDIARLLDLALCMKVNAAINLIKLCIRISSLIKLICNSPLSRTIIFLIRL
jgi:hypothetical protein